MSIVRDMERVAHAWVLSPEGTELTQTQESLDAANAAFRAGWFAGMKRLNREVQTMTDGMTNGQG